MNVSNIIFTGLFIYLAILAFLYFGQRMMIYQPDRHLESPGYYGVPEMAPVDNKGRISWYAAPKEKHLPVIALFQGNAGHLGYRAFKARAFMDADYGVLLVGYSGYGGNVGSPSEEQLDQDAREALKATPLGNNRLVLYGESLGTGVAVQMALEGIGSALVLEAPYSTLADVAAHHYPIFPVQALIKDRFDSVMKIKDVTIPKLFVHGERDRIIPVEFGQRLFRSAAEPKTWHGLSEAGHNDLFSPSVAREIVVFLDRIYGKT